MDIIGTIWHLRIARKTVTHQPINALKLLDMVFEQKPNGNSKNQIMNEYKFNAEKKALLNLPKKTSNELAEVTNS